MEYVQLVCALIGVLALIFLFFWILRKVNKGILSVSGKRLKVLDRASLGGEKSVVVVSVAGKCMVLGVTAGRIDKIEDLSITEEEYMSELYPEGSGRQDNFFAAFSDAMAKNIKNMRGKKASRDEEHGVEMTRAFGLTIRKMFIDNKRIFIRFIVSLTVCIALIGVLCSVTAFAADNNASGNAGATTSISDTASANTSGGTQSADSSVMKDLIGVDGSQSLEVILLVTVLSLAPSLLVMMTSFARIIICFSFLRTAMQTQSTPPNMVLTGLSLFLTIFIMWPVFSEINETAYQPYAAGEMTMEQAIDAAGKPLKTFMLKQTTNDDMKFFLDLKGQSMSDVTGGATDNITLENYSEKLGFETVIPAFIVSELKRAFQMGFLIFIPFLVIDLVVSSTLMAMGMMMLPPAMISLPFKIILFVLVDGWQLMVGTIVNSYNL